MKAMMKKYESISLYKLGWPIRNSEADSEEKIMKRNING